jgi:hypothetical protein
MGTGTPVPSAYLYDFQSQGGIYAQRIYWKDPARRPDH